MKFDQQKSLPFLPQNVSFVFDHSIQKTKKKKPGPSISPSENDVGLGFKQ